MSCRFSMRCIGKPRRQFAAAFMIVAVCSSAADAYANSTVRCDGGVVVTGDHVDDVLRKCGEPVSATSSSRIVGGGYDHYGYPISTREVIVERLTFDFGYGKFRQTLRFEDGELTSITRGERTD